MLRQQFGRIRRTAGIALCVSVAMLALTGVSWGATEEYDPATDANSMHGVATTIGVKKWWDAGYTGEGIDVAVIDSGVSPVPGLDAPGKIIHGPDLSLESQASNLTRLDTYGHGTFMAGLIAGLSSDVTPPYSAAPADAYRGIAPDARIVNLKVATADGGADVSQVIAAINWVVEHAHDPGLNIRVVSLSYGTNSKQTYDLDPLAFAVEQAWKKGIVVVAAAGNTGYQRGAGAPGLANPAYNPYVIAVAASDSMGTVNRKDDDVAPYSASSAGCGSCKKPDLVAPGSHLQGLRVGNSYIDANHSSARLGATYFRGSGTSQAAAVLAGAVALILEKYPQMSPDLVKRFLKDNAGKLGGFDSEAQGAGQIRLAEMAAKNPPWSYTGQSFPNSTGRGSLEASRGRDHLTRDGVVLAGERDIFGNPVDTAALASAAAAGSSWSGGTWNGSSWSGSSWSGSSWSGSSWSGSSWSGSSWSGSSWSGSSWSGSSWSGSSWSGSSWSGDAWTGNSWATAAWN